jgi:predicted nucleic acid-binding protein
MIANNKRSAEWIDSRNIGTRLDHAPHSNGNQSRFHHEEHEETRRVSKIAVEAEAVLAILALSEAYHLKLISSEALLFEIGRIPDQARKDVALAILNIAKETVELTPELEALAERLRASGLKPLDALHLAFASFSKADYFCTCDDYLLIKGKSFEGLNTSVVSPIELVMELAI